MASSAASAAATRSVATSIARTWSVTAVRATLAAVVAVPSRFCAAVSSRPGRWRWSGWDPAVGRLPTGVLAELEEALRLHLGL